MAKNPASNAVEPDNPAQFKRFLDLAEEVGAEGNPAALQRAVKKLAVHPRTPPAKLTKGKKKAAK